MYINRFIETDVNRSIETFPVTAILGPRQSGKSTLARHIISQRTNTLFLDLERPSDLNKLSDPEWFLTSNKGKLFCIDEIQRKPGLFSVIRSMVDEWSGTGHFLILGSASQELIRQSSETLAGRISFHRLTQFTFPETQSITSLEQYLIRGGFPGSLLKKSINDSLRWRENFITTFIERDLLQWSGISPNTMRRLWQMLAHLNGQVVNYSVLANSLEVSHPTIRNYIDLLGSTFMVEIVSPFQSNTGKRIIKAPKVYINDPGLINVFTGILSYNQLSGHPSIGALWETVVLIHVKAYFPFIKIHYYRTSHGAELDFILEFGSKILAIECKTSLSPSMSKGNYISLEDTKASKLLVVIPALQGWEKSNEIKIVSLGEALNLIRSFFFAELE